MFSIQNESFLLPRKYLLMFLKRDICPICVSHKSLEEYGGGFTTPVTHKTEPYIKEGEWVNLNLSAT